MKVQNKHKKTKTTSDPGAGASVQTSTWQRAHVMHRKPTPGGEWAHTGGTA